MAPRETSKTTPKMQRSTIIKSAKAKASPAKLKNLANKKNADKISSKVNNVVEMRPRTNTVPKISTPKPKENKSNPLPGTIIKSAKKSTWKRRPKPAHSGVPVPEKMKKLIGKQLQDHDCSL